MEEKMRELKILGYATLAFMIFVIIGVNFHVNEPIKEQPHIELSQSVLDTELKVQLKEGIVLGKYYTNDGYYIIVWDEEIKKPVVHDLDKVEWERIRFGDID